jgi:hypothetical protein
MGWSCGTAHEVAAQIMSNVAVIRHHLPNLRIYASSNATLTESGEVRASGAAPAPLPSFSLVILATGFGVEISPPEVPLNSYWRVDSLDQSFLGDKPTIVVVGAGDGALTDVLRSCLQRPDQGPFLDHVLALTLEDSKLRQEIMRLERTAVDADRLWEGYTALEGFSSLAAVDQLISRSLRRRVSVKWCFLGSSPFGTYSHKINRFLVSRLARLTRLQDGPDLQILKKHRYEGVSVRAVDAGQANPPRYVVHFKDLPGIECHVPVIRVGNRKVGKLHESIVRAFEVSDPGFLKRLEYSLGCRDQDHLRCFIPAWNDDFASRLESQLKPAPQPILHCAFVRGFRKVVKRLGGEASKDLPDQDLAGGCCTRPDGDLSPPSLRGVRGGEPAGPGKPISRIAVGDRHEQWINTGTDYPIRVRISDGLEWEVGTVMQGLRRHYNGHGKVDMMKGVENQDGELEAVANALDRMKQQTSSDRKSRN